MGTNMTDIHPKSSPHFQLSASLKIGSIVGIRLRIPALWGSLSRSTGSRCSAEVYRVWHWIPRAIMNSKLSFFMCSSKKILECSIYYDLLYVTLYNCSMISPFPGTSKLFLVLWGAGTRRFTLQPESHRCLVLRSCNSHFATQASAVSGCFKVASPKFLHWIPAIAGQIPIWLSLSHNFSFTGQ